MGTKTKRFRDKKEDVEDYCCPQHLVFQYDFQRVLSHFNLILILVEEEIFLTWIVRPNVFDAFIHFAFIFHFLKVFDNFERSTRTHGVVDKFFSGCWPGRIFKL